MAVAVPGAPQAGEAPTAPVPVRKQRYTAPVSYLKYVAVIVSAPAAVVGERVTAIVFAFVNAVD
jgi:hypothetical protein